MLVAVAALEEKLYKEGAINSEELFKLLFSPDALTRLFLEKFARSTGKGTDRLNGFQFALRAGGELEDASARCYSGAYRFAPYLEVLKTKGRSSKPRLIGIPTIRDRVILSQLGRYLAAIYPERVPRNVASSYVRAIAEDLLTKDKKTTWTCSTDIKTFYDSVLRDRLLTVLKKRVKAAAVLKLIEHALRTPTVPKNARRSRHAEFRTENGVPQGLAISNILASIYMQDVDEDMVKLPIVYYRYVDDVLMYGERDAIHEAFESLRGRLQRRGLSLHRLGSSKTQIKELEQPFGYLGYEFVGDLVTVRESTVEKLLHSIASKFSEFVHNKGRRLERFKYLTEARLAQIFMLELNERITGAISGNRRYGWIAYFSQINDLSLLHRLDHSIEALFKRLPEFERKAPPDLKKLRRAYWEMKFNPNGGYVRDYDKIILREDKLQFLVDRGRMDPEQALTDAQIDEKYEKYLRHVLASMHSDEGAAYG